MLVDKDSKRYFTLAAGECPIHELYLPELLARNRGQRLSFSDSLAEAVQFEPGGACSRWDPTRASLGLYSSASSHH